MPIFSRRRANVYILGCCDDSPQSEPLIIANPPAPVPTPPPPPSGPETDIAVMSLLIQDGGGTTANFRARYQNNGPLPARVSIPPWSVSGEDFVGKDINYSYGVVLENVDFSIVLTNFYDFDGTPFSVQDSIDASNGDANPSPSSRLYGGDGLQVDLPVNGYFDVIVSLDVNTPDFPVLAGAFTATAQPINGVTDSAPGNNSLTYTLVSSAVCADPFGTDIGILNGIYRTVIPGSIEDESSSTRPVTTYGDISLSSVNPKFPPASLDFLGTGTQYGLAINGGSYNPINDDITIQMYVAPAVITGGQVKTLFSIQASVGVHSLRCFLSATGFGMSGQNVPTLTYNFVSETLFDGAYHYLEYTRISGVAYLHIDGVLKLTAAFAGGISNGSDTLVGSSTTVASTLVNERYVGRMARFSVFRFETGVDAEYSQRGHITDYDVPTLPFCEFEPS